MRKNNKLDFNSNWITIVPIKGLWLTESINNEIKVGNVIFVTRNKLPRIRKRIGIKVPVSKLSEIGLNNPTSFKERIKDFFKSSKTYAVLNFSGIPKENYNSNIRLIEDAINLISFSTLGYSTRKFNSKIDIKNSEYALNNRTLVIDKKNLRLILGNKSKYPLPLELNERWKNFHNSFHFHKLLKIVNGEIKINRKWKNLLISVAKIVGKSLNSHDIPESFLKNVIALEMLLVNQDGKIKEKIIERSSYLLDWCDKWEKEKIEDKINDIYKKRCDYVHDGKYEDITKEDLIFTDDLIFNIYNNLLKNIDKISSKGKLIEFSDKYKCEKKLNLKSKFQFGKFQYTSKTYEKSEIENI
ncbi:hypothetical protein KO506_06910 [Polaribacter vadi]|uniref:HEPN domain-containing protein n=1 Tax=Polaribacter TaxID=52959 RepID=UPI001C09A596|nr:MULTISPECIES: HEPN domain-containing protein [Polaribacter]MBU3011126.1 hypothetical protein [Polaribacter vadi]MDO6740940.1 HEPN domain-containing protein [Polaribacter sp. 1_MG-2023]